ncbi:MAG: hypothetical protein DMD35_07815 [Gemmatimonadetes bacterium]|nr:MAG: hypothetical protein DMD35_07815 [Gemmatimonadota bacterium]
MHLVVRRRLALLFLYVPAAAAGAQGIDTTLSPVLSCDGRTVTRVEIRPGRPPFQGTAAKWRVVARAVGLHHATTQAHVLESFVALKVGRPCTEFRRAESERVLRAQPFIADARVRIFPDSGGVAVLVQTTDEIAAVVGGSFRGISPQALSIGNANIGGGGVRAEVAWEHGRAYRTGYGGHLVSYAAFDRPYVMSVDANQHRIGHGFGLELYHPFFTDLQRVSWHAGARASNIYQEFTRPARDPLALELSEQRWDVSAIFRLFGTRTVTLLGGAVTGRDLSPADGGVIVSDTGFAVDSGIALRNRYDPFTVARAGVILGLRRVTYVQVTGFDALTGVQDVASGLSGALFVARGLPGLGEADVFLSGATYAGVARRKMLLANLAQVEARRDRVTPGWNSVIGSTRTALYLGGAPGTVLILSDEYSGGLWSRLPLQVTLRDRQGGIRGYGSSGVAGERRNVARSELRQSWTSVIRGADIGVAAFGEVGTLIAGDAPYGWTGSRSTVGLSLLAAYPSRSKRVYRMDLAIPLVKSGVGGGKIELRFSGEDRTARFWDEPNDVARSRTGELPSSLFAWPTR